MKNTLSASPRRAAPTAAGNNQSRLPDDQDRGTRYAFYFLMATLGAALLYFLLLLFII